MALDREDPPSAFFLGRTLSRRTLVRHSAALATYLGEAGVRPGDRVLLQLQNMPQALISCRAIWQLGAVVVPINAMYKAAEVEHILGDCRPSAAIVLDELYKPVLAAATIGAPLPTLTTAAGDYADPEVAREMGLVRTPCPGADDFLTVVNSGDHDEQVPFDRSRCSPTDLAALVYTSGTTGPPKAAMVQHRQLTYERELWSEVFQFTDGDAILGVAPFFHITGLVADLVVALDCGVPITYLYRFEPVSALQWIEHYRPTSLVAAITVYTALLNQPELTPERVSSLRTCLTGGAPVSPATVQWWRERTGHYLRNTYGMTETSSLVTLTPGDREGPTDERSGALSIGRAVAGAEITIRDESDDLLPDGEIGHIVIRGPQITAGYWEKPEETAQAFRHTGLHTGDVGTLIEGWLFLVDRSKDLIVTSGYKVWPREVEDVLMQHPAVREAGVIGVPDDYRGERIVAFVTLRQGQHIEGAELVAFCRDRIAVFKAPREVRILAELPRNLAGKILRRDLRELMSRHKTTPEVPFAVPAVNVLEEES
jgi:long-chain acyl-CoA synthetase